MLVRAIYAWRRLLLSLTFVQPNPVRARTDVATIAGFLLTFQPLFINNSPIGAYMEDIVWDESLSVGVEEIDEDHRRLVELYNLLNHAVAEEVTPNYVDALLEELICCTIWHFRHEERLMLKYQYDALEDHRAEHRDLIEDVRQLQQNFRQENKRLSSEDIEYLSNWLTEHIVRNDMRMGFHLMKLLY